MQKSNERLESLLHGSDGWDEDVEDLWAARWIIVENVTDYPPDEDCDIHVIPTGDLTEHIVSRTCPCQPYHTPDTEAVYTHNSYDGREHTYEQGWVH